MKPTEIKYMRRYVTGEYEFEEYTVTRELKDGEFASDVLRSLQAGIEASRVWPEPATEKAEDKKEKKISKKKGNKKDVTPEADITDEEDQDGEVEPEEGSRNDSQGDQDDEATDDEADDFLDNNSPASSGEDDEEEQEEITPVKKPAKAAKPAAKESDEEPKKDGKKFKQKPQHYDRTLEQHKEIFSGLLRSVRPDWKESDFTKSLAKQTSQELVGEPFLDEKGDVLPNFLKQVKKMMNTKK